METSESVVNLYSVLSHLSKSDVSHFTAIRGYVVIRAVDLQSCSVEAYKPAGNFGVRREKIKQIYVVNSNFLNNNNHFKMRIKSTQMNSSVICDLNF